MKKFIIQSIALIIIISGGLYFYLSGQNILLPMLSNRNTPTEAKKVLSVNQSKFNVEIANTQEKRNKGLGGRDSLNVDEGMLFVFDKENKYSFWMKGMRFPLDIVWIKGDKVVDILTNVNPPQPDQKDETLPILQPVVPVDKVLEINSGLVDKFQIKIGDSITLLN